MADFAASDGLRLHYEDRGAGQPLLCLAGLTRNCRDFDFVAPHLTGLRVIAMDYRGRGRSAFDPDYRTYSIGREMQDALELLDHLGLDRVTLLGTSRGGLIAMAMAAAAPQRLAGAILNDVGPAVGTEGIARIVDYVGVAPAWSSLDQAAAALQVAHAGSFPGVPLERWRAQAAAMFAPAADGLALRYDPMLKQTLRDQIASDALVDLWALFEALKPVPTGVLRGANSDILETATLAEMHRRHPGLISADVPDRGHVPFLDEPQSLGLIRRILEVSA